MKFLWPLRLHLNFGGLHVRDGDEEFLPGISEPGRGADQRVCGFVAGELSGHGRGGGAGLRADAVHAAGEFVRDGGIGGGAAGHVERAGHAG